MKVTGETFSFILKKRSRRGKILNVSKLSEKRTVTGQNSGVVKRGHSSFVFPQLYLAKSKVCPRFTKIVFC